MAGMRVMTISMRPPHSKSMRVSLSCGEDLDHARTHCSRDAFGIAICIVTAPAGSADADPCDKSVVIQHDIAVGDGEILRIDLARGVLVERLGGDDVAPGREQQTRETSALELMLGISSEHDAACFDAAVLGAHERPVAALAIRGRTESSKICTPMLAAAAASPRRGSRGGDGRCADLMNAP